MMVATLVSPCYDPKPTGVAWISDVIKADCPKCLSANARYVVDGPDIILRCLCGLHKVVHTTLKTMTITHRDTEEQARLPRRNSKLYRTLAVLYVVAPATTQQVTEMLELGRHSTDDKEEYTVSDVASQLTVLKYRRLVDVVSRRKGVPGGSTWDMTSTARRLFERGK